MRNIYFVITVITILTVAGCKEDQPSEPPASKEPIVDIITPGNNSSVYGNTYIEVEVTHDIKIAQVDVYIDGISDPGKTFEWDPGKYRYVWSIPQSANGRTYNLYATAEDEGGCKGRSETIEVVVYQFPAPTELGITHISPNEVKLHWVDNADYEEGYIIERRMGIDYLEIGRVDADVKTYNDNSLSESGKYYYRVKAYTGSYSTGNSNEIRIHYVQNLDIAKVLEGHSGTVAACDFNPVQDILATGSSDYSVKLWSTTDGNLLHTLNAHEGFVNSVVFTPNGEMLASTGNDKTIRIWTTQNGELIANMNRNQHTRDINAIDINPDGNTIVSVCSGRLIKLWDVQSRQILKTIDFFDDVFFELWPLIDVKYNHEGKHIALAHKEHLYLIDPLRQNFWPPINSLKSSTHDGIMLCLHYGVDGHYILAGYTNGIVCIWDAWEPNRNISENKFQTEYLNQVYAAVFSPDSEWILCGGSNGIIYSVKASSRDKIQVIDADNGVIYSIDYSPDGLKAASCHQNGNVILWDVSMRWTLID